MESRNRVMSAGDEPQANRRAIAGEEREDAFLATVPQELGPLLWRSLAVGRRREVGDRTAGELVSGVPEHARHATRCPDVALVLVGDEHELRGLRGEGGVLIGDVRADHVERGRVHLVGRRDALPAPLGGAPVA